MAFVLGATLWGACGRCLRLTDDGLFEDMAWLGMIEHDCSMGEISLGGHQELLCCFIVFHVACKVWKPTHAKAASMLKGSKHR